MGGHHRGEVFSLQGGQFKEKVSAAWVQFPNSAESQMRAGWTVELSAAHLLSLLAPPVFLAGSLPDKGPLGLPISWQGHLPQALRDLWTCPAGPQGEGRICKVLCHPALVGTQSWE